MFENVLKKKSVINIKEKNLVLAVIKSDLSAFIRGKFETKAQILAKRPVRGYWRPLQATEFFSLIFCFFKKI